MKRVMFEYDMFGGFVEINEPRMLHPEADELWTDHGEVPDSVWDHYQSTLVAMREAFETLRMNLKPLNLTAEDVAEAKAAWDKHEAEMKAILAEYDETRESLRLECPHTDDYGSLFTDDGSCMVCGFMQHTASGAV